MRPVFHFRPPAQWMNDPNGTFFHDGYYHVFYQHNPYADTWGHMHWGHARSKDLVQWEHLPIALPPSLDLGEEHCFSGCAWVNEAGEPMLFYTSVAFGSANRPNEQWAALPLDEELLTWKKYPANPMLSLKTHGGPEFGRDWRDPFIFEEAGRTFLVLGADTSDEAVIPIYEAKDPELTEWEYRGNLFSLPKSELGFFECPNFFKLDGQWVLFTSPYRPVEYFIGDFELDTYKFTPKTHGVLDAGAGGTANFYATNITFDEQGRCILYGWVRGFPEGRGWNGCLALPRVLTIREGHPVQVPVPELQTLRDRHFKLEGQELAGAVEVPAADTKGCAELIAVFQQPEGDVRYGLKVEAADAGEGIPILFEGGMLTVAGTEIPLTLEPGEELKLHVFLDRSVLEVFVNDGQKAVTRVIAPGKESPAIQAVAEGGKVKLVSLDGWSIRPIGEK
jgi:beta-fructofuranosidase